MGFCLRSLLSQSQPKQPPLHLWGHLEGAEEKGLRAASLLQYRLRNDPRLFAIAL